MLSDWLRLRIPIIQAPMGGIGKVELASEVGRAGGVGVIAATWLSQSEGRDSIAKLKAKDVPVILNFVLHFEPENLLALADMKPDAVTLSWGCKPDVILALKQRGIKVGVQCGSVSGAILARDAGADFVILQGNEAGGHVQSTTALYDLLRDAAPALGPMPVVAAGGIATGRDIATALKAGASAVMMGTRYVATIESNAHDDYKAALVRATSQETAFTNCFDIDWPFAMHRVLRNGTFKDWESAGCPASPQRPGEGDVIGHANGKPVIRYCDTPPTQDFSGSPEEACMYAGKSVDGITAIEPAYDLTVRLWREAQG